MEEVEDREDIFIWIGSFNHLLRVLGDQDTLIVA